MKKILLLLAAIFCAAITNAQTYAWTQKANFGGGARYEPVGFSIGLRGYAGLGVTWTGSAIDYNHQDWWEYDPGTNVWTQKANFIGAGRNGACSFVIGADGYVGTGWTPSQTSTFYKYNSLTNTWSQIATFIGAPRYDAAAFAIGNKGYVGLGFSPYFNDFYEYDPTSNSWTQKANFPGGARQTSSQFVINGTGYVGTGDTQFSWYYDDLWAYDPVSDTWSQKANFPGGGRGATESFVFNNKGFIGTGTDEVTVFKNFWEYDATTDNWSPIPDLVGIERWHAFSFAINHGKGSPFDGGYIGGGSSTLFPNPTLLADFWCYCPTTGIDEKNSANNISIYPNPANDFIFISGITGRESYISIYDMTAKIILKAKINSGDFKINLAQLAEGSYVYEITSGTKKMKAGKLIISGKE